MAPKKYKEEDLIKAVEAVKKGMPFKTAAREHNVPRATIQWRCSDKFTKVTRDPSPILSDDEERTLVR